MFDTIGRDLDEQANRRRAQSFVLSMALMAAGVGFTVGLTMYTAAELVLDNGDGNEMFEVVVADPEEEPPALPDLPPPPPPPAAAAPVERPEAVVPDTAPDPEAELTEPPEDVMRAASAPSGSADGDADGDPDGEDGGRPGGVSHGVKDGTGTAGGGPRVFHHAELHTRRRVDPVYPDAARSLALGEQRCKARVAIDPEGVPVRVTVEACPTVFHEETVRALMRWRWAPPRDENGKVHAVTTIAITYRLQ